MRECAFVVPTNEPARRGAVRADIQPAGSEFGAQVAWKPPPLADKRAPRALCASRSPCGWRGPYPPRPRFARCGQVAGLKGLAVPNPPGLPERGFGPSSEWATTRPGSQPTTSGNRAHTAERHRRARRVTARSRSNWHKRTGISPPPVPDGRGLGSGILRPLQCALAHSDGLRMGHHYVPQRYLGAVNK